jgi:hypothetical protein
MFNKLKLFKKLTKPEEEKVPYDRRKNEYYGVPPVIAVAIMDESFTPSQINSSSIYSKDKINQYCKLLFDANRITEERYLSVVSEEPNNSPMVSIREDNQATE